MLAFPKLRVKFVFEWSKQKSDLYLYYIGNTCSNINNIVIDKLSLEILRGSEIDFTSELMGTSFKISNPKTKSSCGCGISFSI